MYVYRSKEHSLKVGGKPKLERRNIMSKKINGRVYYLVDVIYDDELIYDVYEDSYGNQLMIPAGER